MLWVVRCCFMLYDIEKAKGGRWKVKGKRLKAKGERLKAKGFRCRAKRVDMVTEFS